jgi:beta-glucanase (GH16 family)
MSGFHLRHVFACALALGTLALPVSLARAEDEIAGPPFVERFASIDEERWRISDGWTNGSWTANDWRASQVSLIDDGVEIALARRRGGQTPYTSGELQTAGLYRRGYFEARLQAARGSGLVSGFFTYALPDARGAWDEIDVEILGRDTTQVQFTIFHGGERRAVTLPLGFDAAVGMHIYGFEWTPEHIRWYVDGTLRHEETGAALPRAPQRLIVHLWNSATMTDWVGPILPWQAPWTLRVACIAQAESYQGEALCAEM